MTAIEQDTLDTLRATLDQGDSAQVREVLWALGEKVGTSGRYPWQSRKMSDAKIQALVITWHWPLLAWHGDAQERIDWLESWRNQQPGQPNPLDLMVRTAQALRDITEIFPSDLFSVLADHHVWRHSRTASSEGRNNMLHLLARTAIDPGWLEQVLARHGGWLLEHAPEGTSPAWRGCMDRPSAKVADYLEPFWKHGHLRLDTDSPSRAEFMAAASERGQAAQILWALGKDSGAGRLPGIETVLARHRKLDGVRSPARLVEVLEDFELRWGPPGQDEMTGIWTSLFDKHVMGEVGRSKGREAGLAEVYEARLQEAGWWTPEMTRHVLGMCVSRRRADVLALYLERGFVFEEADLRQEQETMESNRTPEAEPNAILALLRQQVLIHRAAPRATTPRKSVM